MILLQLAKFLSAISAPKTRNTDAMRTQTDLKRTVCVSWRSSFSHVLLCFIHYDGRDVHCSFVRISRSQFVLLEDGNVPQTQSTDRLLPGIHLLPFIIFIIPHGGIMLVLVLSHLLTHFDWPVDDAGPPIIRAPNDGGLGALMCVGFHCRCVAFVLNINQPKHPAHCQPLPSPKTHTGPSPLLKHTPAPPLSMNADFSLC